MVMAASHCCCSLLSSPSRLILELHTRQRIPLPHWHLARCPLQQLRQLNLKLNLKLLVHITRARRTAGTHMRTRTCQCSARGGRQSLWAGGVAGTARDPLLPCSWPCPRREAATAAASASVSRTRPMSMSMSTSTMLLGLLMLVQVQVQVQVLRCGRIAPPALSQWAMAGLWLQRAALPALACAAGATAATATAADQAADVAL